MTIWKFILQITGEQTVMMPIDAQLLSIQMQRGNLCVWAKVETDGKLEPRKFEIIGTGHPIPSLVGTGQRRDHLATVQADMGLVWHVFELTI